ncbi:MAG: hypothetical protein AUH43_17480 [Acidobacteria bacterium 13_1_40CM_65_14]|nr:MAG: hypothetical protein AUH43_17480 [Acidobacteria bacterium 13_1_40CM_65_14]
MPKKSARHSVPLAALFVAFCAGALAMWALSSYGPPKPAIRVQAQLDGDVRPRPVVADTRPNVDAAETKTARAPTIGAERVVATTGAAKNLRVPIDGSDVETWKGGFAEHRGNRPHEAVDILAPRNTPIHAVSDGTIAKLFVSNAGGYTVYQFDPSGQLAYYYAHLERYADGLHDGQTVSKGDIIGYVGTSGNAPPGTPHLHFGVFQLDDDRRWWHGKAIDPYEVFHK